MSKMQEEQGGVIKYNLRKLRDIKKYPSINKLLTKPLKTTLKDILEFASEHPPMIEYEIRIPVYMISNVTLTHRARKKTSIDAERTSNRHLNMLCAMRLFVKIPQNIQRYESLIQSNKSFINSEKRRHPINTFTIPRWTREYLEEAEKDAARLLAASISASSISDIALRAAGLLDISDRVYPSNNKEAINRQRPDFEKLSNLIERFINDNGYCTRQNIIDNLTGMSHDLINRLLNNFKCELKSMYNYHRPTQKERKRFNLSDGKYIYTKREAQKEKEIESHERVEDTEGSVNHWQISGQG